MLSRSAKPVLVYLAHGVQGSAVVRAALRRGLAVRALVRDMARADTLRAEGAHVVEADLDDARSLRAASEGTGQAVIQIPTGMGETMRAHARNAFAAARDAGLGSIVLKLASASRPPPCPEPSFVASHALEQIARGSGIPFAVVRPTMYLDNLLKPSARADIVARGVFAPPISAAQRIAWTCVDDCAEAALALLAGNARGDHCIGGPESLTGDELAARLGAGFGRRIAYDAQPLDMFARDVDAAMGSGMGQRVASKFRYFEAHPRDADAILATPFLTGAAPSGFTPTRVEDWARRHRAAFFPD